MPMARYVPRRPDTELAADTRAHLTEVVALVAMEGDDELTPLAPAVIAWMWTLPEVERLEVGSILHEMSGWPATDDCRMVDGRVVGWVVPDPPPGYEHQPT